MASGQAALPASQRVTWALQEYSAHASTALMLLNSSLNSFLDDRSIHSSCARLHRDPPPLPDELFLFLLRENKHQIKALVTPLKIWLSGTCPRHPHPEEILTYRSYWMVKRSTVSILHYKKCTINLVCALFFFLPQIVLSPLSLHFYSFPKSFANFQLPTTRRRLSRPSRVISGP